MLEFDIPAMTCGHCVASVTEAIKAVDPAARVEADLAHKKLRVESRVEPGALRAALDAAGYTPG